MFCISTIVIIYFIYFILNIHINSASSSLRTAYHLDALSHLICRPHILMALLHCIIPIYYYISCILVSNCRQHVSAGSWPLLAHFAVCTISVTFLLCFHCEIN
jgi:hypothetical protein